jgi:hypothetical protein
LTLTYLPLVVSSQKAMPLRIQLWHGRANSGGNLYPRYTKAKTP